MPEQSTPYTCQIRLELIDGSDFISAPYRYDTAEDALEEWTDLLAEAIITVRLMGSNGRSWRLMRSDRVVSITLMADKDAVA